MPETPSDIGNHPQPANTTDLLENLEAGDRDAARDKLIGYSYRRLRRLARKMLKHYPSVMRQVESGDVLHPALMRLHRALAEVTPVSSRHFWNLAALNIRRELLNLVRDPNIGLRPIKPIYDGSDADDVLDKQPDSTGEPDSLAGWWRFHELIDALDEEEREVFYLVWYDWLTQEQAADVLGVSVRTVRRRWLSATQTDEVDGRGAAFVKAALGREQWPASPVGVQIGSDPNE